MSREIVTHTRLELEDLHTLAYAAAFVRGAADGADSIVVTLPPLDGDGAAGLERACGLAVVATPLEVEVAFGPTATTIRLGRPGRL